MSASKVIWSSPLIDRGRKLRKAEKSMIISIKSLKFQIILFLMIVTEMCFNILWRLFGGLNPSIYSYKLICKTVLAINLIFIIGYIYQLMRSRFIIYSETRTIKTEPIIKSITFDLFPQMRYYYEKIVQSKWLSQWLQKDAIEREKIKRKLEEERRKTIYKMYLPSLNKSYNMNMNRHVWPSRNNEDSQYNSLYLSNINMMPNLSFNGEYVPLKASTPYEKRTALSESNCNIYSQSPMCAEEEKIQTYQILKEGNWSNSLGQYITFEYQRSTASPSRMSMEHSPLTVYSTTPSLSEVPSLEVWKRLGIDCDTLDQWILNIKQWLHGTIISRVSQEIDVINQKLVQLGVTDVMIGESNVQTLRQLAVQPGNTFPSLSMLIDFLDCSKDQAYVVNRIKELSQGRSLGKFQWDSGSTGVRHPWREHLPNDTMLILHLMSTYIDSRVHSNLHGVRTFSQQFIVDNLENKDPNDLKDICVLLQVNVQPPLFKIIYNQTILDIAPGRRNLFECFLVFFYKVYKNEGNLRWLNLGRSGLNLNWIFDQEEGGFYQH